MGLPGGGRGHTFLVEPLEHLLQALAQLGLDDLADILEGELRSPVEELGQLVAERLVEGVAAQGEELGQLDPEPAPGLEEEAQPARPLAWREASGDGGAVQPEEERAERCRGTLDGANRGLRQGQGRRLEARTSDRVRPRAMS